MLPNNAPSEATGEGGRSPESSTGVLDRGDLLLALLVGVLSLALYVRTLVPWLLPGDSGEFQVLVHQVGIAHTTGYPVYMLLGKLFISLVPVADIAYRVNLFSAFMAAMAVALTCLAGTLAARSRWGGAAAALILAVSFTFWSQALIAEVYTPGAAFLAAVLVGLLAWERTGKGAPLFLAGLFGGLGLGAHASVGIFAPAAIIFLALHRSRWRTLWKPALLGAGAGLALYLLAFLIVDLHAPPANIFNAAYGPARSAWGLSEADIANPITRIIFVGAGRQWRTALYPDPVGVVKKVGEYVAKLPREFSLLTLILAAAGFLALIRRDWRLAVLFGLGLLSFWLFYFNYHVGDIYVFYIPGYLLLAVLAGAGLGAADRFLAARRLAAMTFLRPLALAALIIIAALPVLSPRLPAVAKGEAPFLGAREYLVNSGTRGLRAKAANTVKALDRDAIVFIDWNRLYPFYTAAHIDGDRPDLRFIEATPRAERPGLALSVIEFVRSRIGEQPIYSVNRIGELERAGFTFRPVMVGPTPMFRIQAQ